MQNTGNTLDVAIQGDGFFKVDVNGRDLYTRAGSFKLNQDGIIVTSNGYPLQPTITVPTETKTITITENGHLTCLDQNSTELASADIPLYTFINPSGLNAEGRNMMYRQLRGRVLGDTAGAVAPGDTVPANRTEGLPFATDRLPVSAAGINRSATPILNQGFALPGSPLAASHDRLFRSARGGQGIRGQGRGCQGSAQAIGGDGHQDQTGFSVLQLRGNLPRLACSLKTRVVATVKFTKIDKSLSKGFTVFKGKCNGKIARIRGGEDKKKGRPTGRPLASACASPILRAWDRGACRWWRPGHRVWRRFPQSAAGSRPRRN